MQRSERRIALRPVSHPLLDRIRRLRLKRERDLAGLHFVEGLRQAMQALESAVPVETLVYSERLCWNPAASGHWDRAPLPATMPSQS